MRNEAEVCTIIRNSLINGFKVPDPSSGFNTTSQRCFDGIGSIQKEDGLHFVCWEAKILKKVAAFPFSMIEPHQNAYLNKYNKCLGVISYVILGVSAGRGDNRMYVFEWNDFMGKLYENGFSIHKKELEQLSYNEVHKDLFTFDNIITKDDLNKVYGNMDEVLAGLIEKKKLASLGEKNE